MANDEGLFGKIARVLEKGAEMARPLDQDLATDLEGGAKKLRHVREKAIEAKEAATDVWETGKSIGERLRGHYSLERRLDDEDAIKR